MRTSKLGRFGSLVRTCRTPSSRIGLVWNINISRKISSKFDPSRFLLGKSRENCPILWILLCNNHIIDQLVSFLLLVDYKHIVIITSLNDFYLFSNDSCISQRSNQLSRQIHRQRLYHNPIGVITSRFKLKLNQT